MTGRRLIERICTSCDDLNAELEVRLLTRDKTQTVKYFRRAEEWDFRNGTLYIEEGKLSEPLRD